MHMPVFLPFLPIMTCVEVSVETVAVKITSSVSCFTTIKTDHSV